MTNDNIPWWKEAVLYQIYPRSFRDTTGTGTGDLQGIIESLDYLKDLGITALWISPFFKSPQRDFGYDVADYLHAAPEYGTDDDIGRLIEECHRRGMKILFDLVLNHTSDQHPWFLESSSSRSNPKRDWYVWKDGRGRNGRKPPNNWESLPGGSGWRYHEPTGQWYWTQFLSFQPDLNWRNPEVKNAMFAVVRHWLDAGVDGFRLDIIGTLLEDAEFRNNPPSIHLFPSEERGDRLFRSAIRTRNHPDNFRLMEELRGIMDEYPDRFLVGEVFGSLEELRAFCGTESPNGLHTVFNFRTLGTPLKASPLKKLMTDQEKTFPEPYFPVYVFSNHDRARRISVLNNDTEKAKLQALFQLTIRGLPVIYYGEETGLPQADIGFNKSLDPITGIYSRFPEFIIRWLDGLTHGGICRDNCRTPMIWNDSPGRGFTSEETAPWLPFSTEDNRYSVKTQQSDPDSLLNVYKALLALRNRHTALRTGEMVLLPAPRNILAYCRTTKAETLNIIINLSRKPYSYRAEDEFSVEFKTWGPPGAQPGSQYLSVPAGCGCVLRSRSNPAGKE